MSDYLSCYEMIESTVFEPEPVESLVRVIKHIITLQTSHAITVEDGRKLIDLLFQKFWSN